MFSRMQLLATEETVTVRFNALKELTAPSFSPKMEISGFEHDYHPLIVRKNTGLICDCFRWGLVPPDWHKAPADIWNHTISAKLEYLHRRYAWQKVSQNRCLVPATAYFEYHWHDAKGSTKTKYRINHSTEEVFALAGLFSVWINPSGMLRTFAVCTTVANEIMTFVHNKDAARHYHRMPVMLERKDENDWLDPVVPYMDFAFPNYRPNLIATAVGKASAQTKLF